MRHFPNVSQIPSFCRRLWGISCRGAAELRDGRHALDRADPMSPVRGKAAIMERSAPQPVAPLVPELRSRCQCPFVFISFYIDDVAMGAKQELHLLFNKERLILSS